MHEAFDRKMEIEFNPPMNLYEDTGLESSNNNNN